jgi:hypothetical protein
MSQGSQGQDAGGGAEITWVGEQRLMDGYCGRATAAAATKPAATNPALPAPTALAAAAGGAAAGLRRVGRPIATTRGRTRRRETVVRVGPPRPARDEAPQEAA